MVSTAERLAVAEVAASVAIEVAVTAAGMEVAAAVAVVATVVAAVAAVVDAAVTMLQMGPSASVVVVSPREEECSGWAGSRSPVVTSTMVTTKPAVAIVKDVQATVSNPLGVKLCYS